MSPKSARKAIHMDHNKENYSPLFSDGNAELNRENSYCLARSFLERHTHTHTEVPTGQEEAQATPTTES